MVFSNSSTRRRVALIFGVLGGGGRRTVENFTLVGKGTACSFSSTEEKKEVHRHASITEGKKAQKE